MTVDAIAVLRALRSRSLADRADERSERVWHAACPLCPPLPDGLLPLTITEAHRDGPVRLSCRNGCDEAAVFGALGLEPRAASESEPASRRRLRVLDVEHMLRTEPEPVPWIAAPLLVRGAVTMLAGREGQGKSLLALALAAGIGHGSAVAGIDCRPGRVLVVDAENGEREAHRRVRGLGVKPGALVYAEAEWFDLRRDLAEVETLLARHRPDVLVLDSFRSLAPGLEENESGPAETALGPLRGFGRRFGCAVLVLHHTGKTGDGYRGSTAIGAAVELGFTLTRDRDDPQVRTRRKLSCWKCRVAREPEPMWLSIEADDGRVRIGRAEPFDGGGKALSRADDLASRFGDAVAAQGELAWAELCRVCGVGPETGTAKRARDTALRSGLLQRVAHGRYGPPDQPSSRPTAVGATVGRTFEEAA